MRGYARPVDTREILHPSLRSSSLLLISYTGKQCSYEELNLAELEKKNCQQIVNGTAKRWLTMECRYQCRSTLCKYFALCLDQTSEWEKLCSKKFDWFRLYSKSPFDIATAAVGIDVSYLRNIHVKFCRTRRKGRRRIEIWAIKITEHECESRKTTKGLYYARLFNDRLPTINHPPQPPLGFWSWSVNNRWGNNRYPLNSDLSTE